MRAWHLTARAVKVSRPTTTRQRTIMSSVPERPAVRASDEELARHRGDQDRTLEAIRQIEDALAAPAPGRERAWRDDVLAGLEVLDDATTTEVMNAARPDSLVSEIARTRPRL